MFYYAQLDENDICIGISELSGPVGTRNMVSISAFNTGFIGRPYDRAAGTWGEAPEAEPQPPTQSDRIEANTDYIVMMLN